MTYIDAFAILALTALIHASFQLSVSMLTVISGHALSRQASHRRLLRLMTWFSIGGAVMIALLLSFLWLAVERLQSYSPLVMWAGLSGMCIGVGVAVWAFYYRHRTTGTVLWVPRPMAEYLSSRSRATKSSAESLGLGMSSIVGELLFSLAPLLVAAMVIHYVPSELQLVSIIGYSLIASLPLIAITVIVGGGRSISKIQKWRETNKRFLQFVAGSALIVLGAYLYVDIVLGTMATQTGGAL